MTKQKFFKLNNLISISDTKDIVSLTKLSRIMKLDRRPVNRMKELGILKSIGNIYSEVGIIEAYKRPSKKRIRDIKKEYVDIQKKKFNKTIYLKS